MHIVKDLAELKKLLERPNPNEIYGFVPREFVPNTTANPYDKINKVFQHSKNCLVYTDVLEIYNDYYVPRFNPSFDVGVIQRGFKLNSPFFIKTDKPLLFDREDINEIVLQLLQQIIGIHIAELAFIWKGPQTETNIQS